MADSIQEEYANQQTWASMAYELLRSEILPDAPERAIVTFGFPHVGDLARGECWLTEIMADEEKTPGLDDEAKAVIFIHPSQWRDAETVLMVLTHEMIHASGAMGHGQPYKAVADIIGLGESTKGIFDAPNPKLQSLLFELAETLPRFPVCAMTPKNSTPIAHGGSGGSGGGAIEEPGTFCPGGKKVDAEGNVTVDGSEPKKKQKNRQLLHECRCGQKIRCARKTANATCTLCHTDYELKSKSKGGAS